ncbi:hypothetical protein HPB50_004454 [Hyalomma asiaticum]|uniref:Uncharacterized protein n=1 Tax=Hyalomma asiaticum TaxID=266040 RepID=A0ACB7TH23_HYAAI|nr:hypothetical protein HPB50_004454 [Hyalomma asiaticum]
MKNTGNTRTWIRLKRIVPKEQPFVDEWLGVTLRRRPSHGASKRRPVTTRGPSACGDKEARTPEARAGPDRAASLAPRPTDAMTPLAGSTGCQSPMAPVNAAVRQGESCVPRAAEGVILPRVAPFAQFVQEEEMDERQL